jgi:hypothetical protein
MAPRGEMARFFPPGRAGAPFGAEGSFVHAKIAKIILATPIYQHTADGHGPAATEKGIRTTTAPLLG